MEAPALARYIHQKSKKRVFPGSSSSYVDPEVFEIPPPMSWSSKSKSVKEKEAINLDIIDIDMDEDSVDVMLIDDKVDLHSKGKEVLDDFSYGYGDSTRLVLMDAIQSSKRSSLPGPLDSFNCEGYGNEFSYGDDEHTDQYHDDLTCDDEYTLLQAHFDNIDIPPGVEAPIPWFCDTLQEKMNTATSSSSNPSMFPIRVDSPTADSSCPQGISKPAPTGKRSTSLGSSSLQIHLEALSPSKGVDLSSLPWSVPETASNKKKSVASKRSTYLKSQTHGNAQDHPSGFKSWCIPGYSHSKNKLPVSDSPTNYTSPNQLGVKLNPLVDALYEPNALNRLKFKSGNGTPNNSWFSAPNFSSGPDAYMSGWQNSSVFVDKPSFGGDGMYGSSDAVHFLPEDLICPPVQGPGNNQNNVTASGSSTVPLGSTTSIANHASAADIMRRFQLFKQFDTVQDHSDHHFSRKGSSVKQPSKNWTKKIQEEWRILERDLPDSIFVRVYESRVDLLRAAIVGAEGTPYHDGLFFFDVFFPSGYPNVPPHVHYHSGGLRINPNLYNCGKVCLSLLNTWSGSPNEKWIPGVSTMLQVLVSIQALILNAKPYFNEPGFARLSGSASGEKSSQQYNENTFILSLKTMVYTMRRPPKHFEDLVVGHFCKCAQDILVACKAYIEGAQVGCLVKGGVQDVDAGDKSCSQYFKDNLACNISVLVQTFSQIGAEDCEKFLSLAKKGNGSQPYPVPVAPPLNISLMKPQF